MERPSYKDFEGAAAVFDIAQDTYIDHLEAKLKSYQSFDVSVYYDMNKPVEIKVRKEGVLWIDAYLQFKDIEG